MALPESTKEEKKRTIESMLECFDGNAEELRDLIHEIEPNWNELTNFLVAHEDAEEVLAELEKLIEQQGQMAEAESNVTDRSSGE